MRPDFLKGVRFTDMTWAGAGPFGTKLFSDFGAEVLKIESMTRPDTVRLGGPFKDGIAGINRSGYFASRNSGKKSVSINVKSDEGQELVLELVRKSDVLSNNFGPGAMQRLGLGYDDVRRHKKDIIYLSMPMYGESGPRAPMLGVGMTISAITSLMWMTAYGENEPVGPGTHYPDHAANPYHAAFAVAAALRYRRLTGKGMKIDLSQVESTINFAGNLVLEREMTGKDPRQIGNRSLVHAPHNVFSCRGDDEWVAVAVEEDSQWEALAAFLADDPRAGDPALHTVQGRLEHVDLAESILSDWCRSRTAAQAVEALRRVGVPAAFVATSRYLIEKDPDLQRRHYWQRPVHSEIGPVVQSSPPYTIDGERVDVLNPPLFGEHTDSVLGEVLGIDAERIHDLREREILK